jgi:hypothetical protein
MIRCRACGKSNLDSSQYCDECGAKIAAEDIHRTDFPSHKSHTAEVPIFSGPNATSVGTPPIQPEPVGSFNSSKAGNSDPGKSKARLTIERGDASGTEFPIIRDEAIIGRWDADNGIFPDIDLDSFDQEAKVSRRHARIIFRESRYFVEDLGSTNGTYINRGRRLLPGTPQPLSEGDEIIVGKTFLRFHINN